MDLHDLREPNFQVGKAGFIWKNYIPGPNRRLVSCSLSDEISQVTPTNSVVQQMWLCECD